MRKSLIAVISVFVVCSALALMAGQDSATPWEVPDDAKAMTNPVEKTPEALAAAAALYKKHCVMCHGESGKGDGPAAQFMKPAPPDITTAEVKDRLTDGEIFYKITTGKKPMPAMDKKLNDTERWQLVFQVRALQGG